MRATCPTHLILLDNGVTVTTVIMMTDSEGRKSTLEDAHRRSTANLPAGQVKKENSRLSPCNIITAKAVTHLHLK
jgi:hypothetical protein